jgi:hypothetical protein
MCQDETGVTIDRVRFISMGATLADYSAFHPNTVRFEIVLVRAMLSFRDSSQSGLCALCVRGHCFRSSQLSNPLDTAKRDLCDVLRRTERRQFQRAESLVG